MKWWNVILLTALASSGCRSCDDANGRSQSQAGVGEEEEQAAGAPASEPPTGVRVRGTPSVHGDVSISVEVRGPSSVRLKREVAIERIHEGRAERVDASGVDLRPSCDADAPECIELVPGAELAPPPWTGTVGEAQCGCPSCAAVPAGRYRFVATTCEGGHRIEGEPFELGRSGHR